MATVLKCSKCGVYESDGNGEPVTHFGSEFCLDNARNFTEGSVSITCFLPSGYRNTDLCGKCLTKLMLLYMPMIAEILAHYIPARVSGFNQGVVVEQAEQLTRDELSALKVLSQRLLKA